MSMGSPTAPEKVAQCMALMASGMKYGDIAATTGVSVYGIKKLAQVPANKVLIEALRSAFKAKSSEMVEKIGPKLDAILLKALESFDPSKIQAKDLDGLFRASLNLEKRSSSIAGDNRVFQPKPARVVVEFADWTLKPGGHKYQDAVTMEPITEAELVKPAQLPPATEDDGDDDA